MNFSPTFSDILTRPHYCLHNMVSAFANTRIIQYEHISYYPRASALLQKHKISELTFILFFQGLMEIAFNPVQTELVVLCVKSYWYR